MGTRSGSYGDILDQVIYAEELGFDTVLLGERHFRYGDLLYPAPFSVAAAIAAKTSRMRIGMAARILALDHPIHIAEDAATLDVLSGGRLDFGATRASLDGECHSVFRSPIDESKGRFREALDIIVKCWCEEQFSYQGLHYRIPEVSVYPKPRQKPYPPISLVAVAQETLTFAAEKGYSAIVGAIRSLHELGEAAESYWGSLRETDHNGTNPELKINRFIYVSDTDEKARAEIEGPFMDFIANHAPDLKAALIAKYDGEKNFDFRRFMNDFCVFGSPETVILRVREMANSINLTHLLCSLNFITQEHKLCIRSMEFFAKEVMPALMSRPKEEPAR
jgi:alkanesulfonate monooxygenase SsuD/methylene tetrahydromethanopterin reductase-like flavin-dependent oxidoreductase (luciferase family)